MTADDVGLRIRPATRGDIPALVQVAVNSVTAEEVAGFGTAGTEQPFGDVGRLSAAWQEPDRVGGQEVLVAEHRGRPVAYVTLEDRDESLELVNIDVARELRGRGIGSRLVAFVEGRAREAGKAGVTLGTSRNAAGVPWKSLPWWQHLGYYVTHEEENAWTRAIGPGAREIRMRKDLPAAEGLVLRDVRPHDLPLLFEQQRDPEANRMAAFTPPDPGDREAFDRRWTRILSDRRILMKTVIYRGRVAGSIGGYVEGDSGRREVTFWIGKEFWGRSIATQALTAYLRLDGTRPLYARAAADNLASIRVLEKCGFTVSERARGFANARGREIEEVAMVLGTAAGGPLTPTES